MVRRPVVTAFAAAPQPFCVQRGGVLLAVAWIVSFCVLLSNAGLTLAQQPTQAVKTATETLAGSSESATAETPLTAKEVDVEAIFAGDLPDTLSIDQLRAMENWTNSVSERVLKYTVGVRVGSAQGSGVIISKDGYVLTAAHVAGKANADAIFFLPDGPPVRGKSLGMNRSVDAGLMKINPIIIDGKPRTWPYASLGESTKLKKGQWCVATGHPGGFVSDRSPPVRLGRIRSNQTSVIVTDCKLVGGDSGGPLFDMEGNVIGIHSRIGPSLALNMHVPVDQFMKDWDRMVSAEEWGNMPGERPVIGVEGVAGASEAKIGRVIENRAADRAGVKVGDVVLKFDGKEVASFAQLQQMVRESRPGKKVKLLIRRGSQELTLELTVENLGRRPRGR